jgi:Rab-like protein 2
VGARYSTYAVNIFKHTTKIDGKTMDVEFWDTGLYIYIIILLEKMFSFIPAGQEKFDNLHQSYFHQAHACIMVCIFRL